MAHCCHRLLVRGEVMNWYIIAATSDQRRAIAVDASGELDAWHVAALMGVDADRVEMRIEDGEWEQITKSHDSMDSLIFVGQHISNNKERIETERDVSITSVSYNIKEKHRMTEFYYETTADSNNIATRSAPTAGSVNFEQYDLPSDWACALMYGDEDSLSDEDLDHLNAFVDAQDFPIFHCVDVESDDGGDFRRYHDATAFGVLACDVSTFTFDVGA